MSERGEAVCFTAGPQGAPFAAGAIHAWLASDRKAPVIAAGCSMGAISAAAMQRCYEELARSKQPEADRWNWFRRYLLDISDRPLDVIWKGLPDPVDYFVTTSPVRDRSCPPELKPHEITGRYHFLQLTKVGVWLAGIPVHIGAIAKLAIFYVRFKEQIPVRILGLEARAAWVHGLQFAALATQVAFQLLWYTFWNPLFLPGAASFTQAESHELSGTKRPWLSGLRPLFGWRTWLAVGFVFSTLVVAPLALLYWLHWMALPLIVLLAALVALLCFVLTGPLTKIATNLLERTGQHAGICDFIVHNYQLQRRLWNLFYDDAPAPLSVIRSNPRSGMHLMVVATPLQNIPKRDDLSGETSNLNQQVWAEPGMPVVDALTSAVSMPGVFQPTRLHDDCRLHWFPQSVIDRPKFPANVDLVDGAVIRRNPLPSLFTWLHHTAENKAVEALTSESPEDCRVHVVYSVPIEPYDPAGYPKGANRIDSVEAARAAMLMRDQRDTTMEVRQTNYTSELALHLQRLEARTLHDNKQLLPVFVDEIAPEGELEFENNLAPTSKEFFEAVSHGCRQTLQVLYRDELKQAGPDGMACYDLMHRVAKPRLPFITHDFSGLPEVCSHCTNRHLHPRDRSPEVPKGVYRTYGSAAGTSPAKAVPNLCQDKQRLVFVASGGVFRGSFHIGLVGALFAARLTPDLIVGASVGTLMGGALAAITNLPEPVGVRMLADLTCTFSHVDEEVALTTPLKTAVKQLGLRARRLTLSPAKVRALVRAGTAGDAGYAATGAPPAVIDTISQLFIIPPQETIAIAAKVLTGSFAEAFDDFLSKIRRKTLPSLDVQYAVIGSSLLEGLARRLMGMGKPGIDFSRPQPYPKTSIFCTTSFVNRRTPLVLGRDSLHENNFSYSFLHAALASSAFPAAFSVRRESEVLPGQGEITNLFSDGGFYDNLPLFPAIHLLRDSQVAAHQLHPSFSALEFLKRRLTRPDLIICGAFDAPPEQADQPFKTIKAIRRRAAALAGTVKTGSFIRSGRAVYAGLQQLAARCPDPAPPALERFMDRSVVAAVVNVCPSSEQHVNPTFGFCRTLGLSQARVAGSIADGCFNTFVSLSEGCGGRTSPAVTASLRALDVRVYPRTDPAEEGQCPFFRLAFHSGEWEPENLYCPFHRASLATEDARQNAANLAVYSTCQADRKHLEKQGTWKP